MEGLGEVVLYFSPHCGPRACHRIYYRVVRQERFAARHQPACRELYYLKRKLFEKNTLRVCAEREQRVFHTRHGFGPGISNTSLDVAT